MRFCEYTGKYLKKCRAKTRNAAFFLFFVALLLPLYAPVYASDITTIGFRQTNGDIVVNAYLQFDQKIIDDLNSGLPKELTFSVELFRSWNFWPNEYIAGRTITRSLQSNPIKREYVGTSIEGKTRELRRFRDVSSMIAWAGTIEELRLSPIVAAEDGDYFIRVSAESRMLALPAVVDYLLFFIPTKEFNVTKDSLLFRFNPQKARK
jgi:hypothetical protein